MVTAHSYGRVDNVDKKKGMVCVSSFPLNIQTSQSQLTITSSTREDSPLGKGAKTVRISGIGSDWTRKGEIIQLKGQEPVLTKNDYIALDVAVVVRAGEEKHNIGDIFIVGADKTLAVIEGKMNKTFFSHIIVPEGIESALNSWYCMCGPENRQSPIEYSLVQIQKNGIELTLQEATVTPLANANYKHTYGTPLPILKPSIICIKGVSEGDGVDMRAGLEITFN